MKTHYLAVLFGCGTACGPLVTAEPILPPVDPGPESGVGDSDGGTDVGPTREDACTQRGCTGSCIENYHYAYPVIDGCVVCRCVPDDDAVAPMDGGNDVTIHPEDACTQQFCAGACKANYHYVYPVINGCPVCSCAPDDDGGGESGGSDGGPPSCAPGGPGMTNCGPGGSGTESCCTSLEVTTALENEASPYYRTYSNAGSGPTGEADPATVSGFRLDEYLVTVGRFRQFVAAWRGGYYPSAGSGKHTHLNGGSGLANSASAGTFETGWDAVDWNNTTDIDPIDANLKCDASYATWTRTDTGGQEDLPINCVTWYEAYAFCIWDGGFLPSEAEWEYAAAAGNQQREYPWGSTAPGTACPGTGCDYAIYGCYYPSGSGGCTGVSNIAPVGYASDGAGYFGQLDLAGELWEWNLDWYNTQVDPCTDCAYLPSTPAAYRVIRGGYFFDDASYLLPPARDHKPPALRYADLGFRCARTP
jgi:formylglycine-generating enzyme required for sulfatase activity